MARRPSTPPAPPVRKEAPAAPTWLRPVVLAFTALLFLASTSSEVGDYDFWWHLKTGQYIVQQHALPAPDQFAFTTYLGKPAYPQEERVRHFNLTHEWLAQILFYLAYAAGGFAGIVLLRAMLIAAFCGLLGLVVYGRTNSFYRGVGAAILAGTVAWQFVPERPYLITFVFLAATVAIVESRRWLWVLPPMFVIWSNCHSGYFLGWVVLALFWPAKSRPQAGLPAPRFWPVALASVLASGLNPNGFLALPVLRWYQSSAMQSSVAEWQYPLPWPPTPFSMLLAGALAVLIWQRRQARPIDWLLLVVFGAASLSAVRNIILAAVPGAILIATYFPWKRSLPRAAEFAVAALLLLATGARIAHGRSFQFRAAEWKFCGGAADFLIAHHVTVPMFNTYEMGFTSRRTGVRRRGRRRSSSTGSGTSGSCWRSFWRSRCSGRWTWRGSRRCSLLTRGSTRRRRRRSRCCCSWGRLGSRRSCRCTCGCRTRWRGRRRCRR